jgi:hypothetical protein
VTTSVDGKLFPTIRMINGKLKKLSVEDAYKIAMEKKDFISFDNDDAATKFSKMLSSEVGKKRKKNNIGYWYMSEQIAQLRTMYKDTFKDKKSVK